MKTKSQKKEQLKELETTLPQSVITIFTTFAREGEKGLSVAQMQELKRALRTLGARYLIAKKNLVDIALRDLKYDGLDVFSMGGSMGIVTTDNLSATGGDPYAVSKKLYEFAKKNQALRLLSAWFEGRALSKEELLAMAQLPSHKELVARLLGMMKYPLSALAIVLKRVGEKKS
ncbi:MAG: 50S ribosomal protein L10 [Patescibacteria group bacterium]